ncbi:MFS transporter [Nocardia cyriacigeorgica]|uniref:Transmembrane efflux protein n=1 Tax=Nocardia cyriacigeorgica (strain GUH-2) TaxID=1127134 RepID=H6R739_NOCCG|nr:MFS transporter [Nocardia cyriacigeorgica]CCF64758.1 Transmembrane efflux protein [Nocardia cyriacigeorgica GUH-2]
MGGQLEQRDGTAPARAQRLAPDFYRLWGAFTVSQIGSALGAGALPMVAILVLEAADLQVSLMAAMAGVASAAIALPMGPFIDFHRKRPIMVGADLLVFGALVSVPLAAWAGVLTYAQLCAVVTIQTVCAIVFNAANGAYVKSLVPQEQRISANSRFETTFWTASTLGAPLGGGLIALFGLTLTVLIDAVSYLLAALGIRGIRTPEPDPPARRPRQSRLADLRSGWSYIFGHPALHRLFWNAMVFGGAILMTTPLMALLMLRELGFAPWQYGLSLGLPCVGGLIGSMCAPRLVAAFGERAVLLGFGLLRTLWLAPLLLAGPNTLGLVLIIATETLLLFCAGVFNPVFTTFRMNNTVDGLMARVGTAWSISSKCAQPVFIAVGGLLAAAAGLRCAIAVAAIVVIASSLLLPWRHLSPAERDTAPVKFAADHGG